MLDPAAASESRRRDAVGGRHAGAAAGHDAAAAAVARAVGYTNAGTIEFLLDEDGRFFFLEMNTRLQVEHPITEMVTGVDLVQWQIRIARGERLDARSGRLLAPKGHAIECRIYAEDPDNGFLPVAGTDSRAARAGGTGHPRRQRRRGRTRRPDLLRPDDLEAHRVGRGSAAAIARMRRALGEYVVAGIRTTLPFFAWLVEQPDFVAGRFHTTFLDEILQSRNGRPFVEPAPDVEEVAVMAAALQVMLSPVRPGGPRRSQAAAADRWKARRAQRACADALRNRDAGRLCQVVIRRTDDTFLVNVDGRLHRRGGPRRRAHPVAVPARSGPGRADIQPGRDPGPGRRTGQTRVSVGALPVELAVNGRRRQGRRSGGPVGSGPQRVVAPMPGKVVRVLVKAGDAVAARQPIVVVEAMKMENELRASGAGTVAEVHAREGLLVDAGALLVVIQRLKPCNRPSRVRKAFPHLRRA